MSKHLSTTQISCPGSPRREQSVSHGLGWAGRWPGGRSLSQSAGNSIVLPGGLAEFSSCLKSVNGVSCLRPSQFVMWLWITLCRSKRGE